MASSDDAGVDRRELDENIAYVVKTDQESSGDQIVDRDGSFLVKPSEENQDAADSNQKDIQ